MRKSFVLVAAVTLLGGMAQAQTPPPSFDCAKAYLPVDYVICSSPELLKVNDELSTVWRSLRERLGEAEGQAALDAQRQWIKEYPQACGLTGKGKPAANVLATAVPCVTKQIRDRAAKLRMQLAELPAETKAAKPAPSVAPPGARWQGETNPVAVGAKTAHLSIRDSQGKDFQATFTVRDSNGANWTFHTMAQGGAAAAVFPDDFMAPRQAGRYSYDTLVDLQPTLSGSFQLP